MKIVRIDKKDWSAGLKKLRKAYRLIGPVQEGDGHRFKPLAEGTEPDLAFGNTRLSAKEIIYPQSEEMFAFSLDENQPDHHQMQEVAKDYSPQAVVGLRPCDAKAIELVRLNFDTEDYQDPYWLNLYEATTLVGLACDRPCGTCFCTTAGCGPYHEEGLDVLLVDDGPSYLAKPLTDKGEALATPGRVGDSDLHRRVQGQEQIQESSVRRVDLLPGHSLEAQDILHFGEGLAVGSRQGHS